MRKQTHVETTPALPPATDALDALEREILQTIDGMAVRDAQRDTAVRHDGRHPRGSARAAPGQSIERTKAIRRKARHDRRLDSDATSDGQRSHNFFLPADFQLAHYSPFDRDGASDGEETATRQTPLPPPPPSQTSAQQRQQRQQLHLEPVSAVPCRLSSPFRPELVFPSFNDGSSETCSIFSMSNSGRAPSGDCRPSLSDTICSPLTPPTSPELDRSPPSSVSSLSPTPSSDRRLSHFEESLFEYYLDDEKEAVSGPAYVHDVADAKMHFSDLRKNSKNSVQSSVLVQRRQSMATTASLTDYQADLSSRDRHKQKDAIKRILSSKVKNDWNWTWPQPHSDASTPVLSRYLEDLEDADWVERDEWTSNVSESDAGEEENNKPATEASAATTDPSQEEVSVPLEDPSDVELKAEQPEEPEQAPEEARRTRRWKRDREEMLTNDGLRCFTERRDAWTGARYVPPRRPSTTTSVASPVPPTPPPKDQPTSRMTLTDATREPLSYEEAAAFFDYMTAEVPIAKPILPPDTPMRNGITEKTYPAIYDKIVVQGQAPLCPINLSVVTKSCVTGWKRDGEWPQKVAEPEPVITRRPPPRPPRPWNGPEIPSRTVVPFRTPPVRPSEAERGARSTGDLGRSMPVRTGHTRALTETRILRGMGDEAPIASLGGGKDNGVEKEGKGVFRRSLQKVFDVVHHPSGIRMTNGREHGI